MALRITYDFDTWDGGTITSSGDDGVNADDNAVHDHVGKVWDAGAKTSVWFKNNLGSATQITCVGIFNHNFTSSATVTLQGNATDSWGAPTYSQALTIATDADGAVIPRIVFFLDQTFQWWRITIEDGTNANDIAIGRIVAGAYYEPDRGIADRFAVAHVDPSIGQQRPGTGSFWNVRPKFRRLTATFPWMDRTQTEKFEAIFNKTGMHEPMILSWNPADYPTKDSMYCYLATPLSLANHFLEQYEAVSLVFDEKVY